MFSRAEFAQLTYAISSHYGIVPELAARVLVILIEGAARGISIKIREGRRSNARQDQLYAQGRNAAGQILDVNKVVTYAKAGQSKHNPRADGLARAVDLDLPVAQREWLGALAVKLGLTWGGTFRSGTFDDWGHVEWNG